MSGAYCMLCGTKTEPAMHDGKLRPECDNCGWIFWDNPVPAVGAVILRNHHDVREVLLCKRAGPPKQGLWDLPGGIMERDESAEDALRRELMEELGVEATLIRMLETGPGDYGGRPTINLLWLAELHGTPTANDDVAELRWFPLADLPELAWAHEAACLQRLYADAPSHP